MREKCLKLTRAGFTLIEMLVVISVIGILVTLASQNNTRVLKKAKDASLKLEVGQLRIAVHQYALDNFGKFPEKIGDLAPDYLKAVPTTWSGANGKGSYSYHQPEGQIMLFDQNDTEPSSQKDSGENPYGSY